MDFSKDTFAAPRPTSRGLSDDTIDHARLVMACRFGWAAGADNGAQGPGTPHLPASQQQQQPPPSILANSSLGSTNKRFLNCRGRLYHQLTCAHRIRTDIVEDCGSNCLEPFEGKQDVPFYCHECVEKEAITIWNARESEHNSAYPPRQEMTTEQYAQWYEEHRQLEAQFAKDRQIHELQRKAVTRPSNVASLTETTDAEMDFATQLDSLSLTMCTSNETITSQQQSRAARMTLPNDPSEQLHWHLNSLALDERGSCGVEYAACQAGNASTLNMANKEELWKSSWNGN